MKTQRTGKIRRSSCRLLVRERDEVQTGQEHSETTDWDHVHTAVKCDSNPIFLPTSNSDQIFSWKLQVAWKPIFLNPTLVPIRGNPELYTYQMFCNVPALWMVTSYLMWLLQYSCKKGGKASKHTGGKQEVRTENENVVTELSFPKCRGLWVNSMFSCPLIVVQRTGKKISL